MFLPPAADDDLSDLVQRAMQAHGSNRSAEARELYAQVLRRQPDHPDALHLLGLLEAQFGRLAEARALIERAVAVRPGEAMFHNNLGNVAMEHDRLDDAERHYRHAVELDPQRMDARANLGVLFGWQRRDADARRLLEQVIAEAPDFVHARQNLANLHLRAGRMEDAVKVCVAGLVVAPRSDDLRHLLGIAYGMLGRRAEARAVYSEWLRDDPSNPIARHHLGAFEGEAVPERASDDYLRSAFDDFAPTFDKKLRMLDYRGPQMLLEAMAAQLGAPAAALDVLDGGCGTGQCGPLLAPWARQLCGVDLSMGMLQRAAQRDCYQRLVCGELTAFLLSQTGAWDLVAASDVLSYFGRLEAFVAAAAGALRDGGWLVFNVESLDLEPGEEPFRLHLHGRYSHRRRYVEGCLLAAGLLPCEVAPGVMRHENQKPVHAWTVLARRGAAGG